MNANKRVLTVFRDFDSECQLVSDSDGLDFPGSAVEDANSWRGGFRCAGDADHFRVSDRHHPEGNILRGHVVRALHFVYLVRLGHHHGMVLKDDGVRVDSSLKSGTLARCTDSLNGV